ncbi:MAG: hypothetical protein GX442_03230 [Candidatus Riflebacteria bacterium]|nr:hypothetical protein [Candidatus Riflebacteria bacterium]
MSEDRITGQPTRPSPRQGIAVVLVLTFVVCTLSLAIGMFSFRKEVKQANVSNVNFLQANFLAQAGVQHALLKCRILPQEAYDSGMAFQGYCPLQAVLAGGSPTRGTSSARAMEIFISDCNSTDVPWDPRISSDLGLNLADWKYEVASMTVIAAFTNTDQKLFVLTSQIIASGTVIEHRGGRGPRCERMVKTIELSRKIN